MEPQRTFFAGGGGDTRTYTNTHGSVVGVVGPTPVPEPPPPLS